MTYIRIIHLYLMHKSLLVLSKRTRHSSHTWEPQQPLAYHCPVLHFYLAANQCELLLN